MYYFTFSTISPIPYLSSKFKSLEFGLAFFRLPKPGGQGIYHNILANQVTEILKVVLESLKEGSRFKPLGHSGK